MRRTRRAADADRHFAGAEGIQHVELSGREIRPRPCERPLARYALNFDRLPAPVQALARASGLGPVCRNPFQSIIVRALEIVYACGEALRLIAAYEPPPLAAPLGAPGRILRIDLDAGPLPKDASGMSSHEFGLAEAVALARTLELAPRRIIVYAVEGGCFHSGAPLTPAVAAAVRIVADRIVTEIQRLRDP